MDTQMAPPKKQPWFFNSLDGSEVTFPDTGYEMAWLVDTLAGAAKAFPDWVLDRGEKPYLPIRLTVLTRQTGQLSEIGFTAGGVEGVVRAEPDPSGWVRITAHVAGRQMFEAYMDHPYEQYPMWPPGADPAPDAEEPGNMSKNRWWVSLSLRDGDWPDLLPIAKDGVVNFDVPDR
jgi:hypothetical protein